MDNATWRIPSRLGQEIIIADELFRCIARDFNSESRLQEIRTAVTEACLNAIEHGNKLDARRFVHVTYRSTVSDVAIRISDEGTGPAEPIEAAADPRHIWQLDNPRGWGLALIHAFTDRVRTGFDEHGYYIELLFKKADSCILRRNC